MRKIVLLPLLLMLLSNIQALAQGPATTGVLNTDSLKKVAAEIKKLIDKVGEHDVQLASIYDTIEDLLDKKVTEQKWEDRIRIGFRSKK